MMTSDPTGPGATAANAETTVLVADDHELFLEGLSLLVETLPGCRVVGSARDGREAVDLAKELQPRVVLMDVRMPGLGGPEATAAILANDPRAAVVMVTMFVDDESVFHALRAGAKGYVPKWSSKDELGRAIAAAANGEALFDQAIALRFRRYFSDPGARGAVPFADLTSREREVLALLARGLSNAEIASSLHVSSKTARNHVSNVLGKLNATTRRDAARWAQEAGLGT